MGTRHGKNHSDAKRALIDAQRTMTGATHARPASDVLVDKLGERLAFERIGVRIYQALIDRWPTVGTEALRAGPTLVELVRVHAAEQRHVELLRQALASLEADAAATTPSGDAASVATTGLVQLICDPRSSLMHCLHALLTVELVDNEGWAVLTELADRLGHEQLAESFREALLEEEEHLIRVRAWGAATTFAAAAVEEPTLDAPPPDLLED